MDGGSIRVHDYHIRLFRTLAGLLALWCIFFLLVLINYHHLTLKFYGELLFSAHTELMFPPLPPSHGNSPSHTDPRKSFGGISPKQ